MSDFRNFKGAAQPLTDGDIKTIAGYLGCHIAALRAVLAVESDGKGFGSDGRPRILNEPHVFYRELGAGAKRNKAVRAGLAYRKWGTKRYPSTQAARYVWLEKAMAIDEDAALKSCSWGLGQCMGFNHKLCGYASVQEFVRAMMHSAGAQLYAMARFIVSNGLQKHLRKLNWRGFAKGYNGPAYASHGYHTKLANSYSRKPAAEKVTPAPATEVELVVLSGRQPAPAETDLVVDAEGDQPVARVEIRACEHCGGSLEIVASIQDPKIIAAVLAPLTR
ncbi:Protein of unknown function [Microbulbifer donghaiensis]|uniref:N-acetylmuramidase domain-containing protein n=1 Tax=Microbulbifer donghaiensis TaxID=494016 RepID=A0A1M4U548_9GAMM|nr:N-acetylmuramidase family protein [Microbulbifer donghaiensis]SHE51667.1 Protein of unknown function [Microbulbifer donghaiensis]